jgi:hypothetical protein
MLINDVIAALEKVPPMLAGGWVVWLVAGALLSRWSKYEGHRLVTRAPTPRPKSGVRPPTAERAAARAPKTIPASAGDAFGELAAMLEPESGLHRMPGDSPVLTNSAGAPAAAPALAAPQSLP